MSMPKMLRLLGLCKKIWLEAIPVDAMGRLVGRITIDIIDVIRMKRTRITN
jgi:Mg/Co/Ni transporter MgtE